MGLNAKDGVLDAEPGGQVGRARKEEIGPHLRKVTSPSQMARL